MAVSDERYPLWRLDRLPDSYPREWPLPKAKSIVPLRVPDDDDGDGTADAIAEANGLGSEEKGERDVDSMRGGGAPAGIRSALRSRPSTDPTTAVTSPTPTGTAGMACSLGPVGPPGPPGPPGVLVRLIGPEYENCWLVLEAATEGEEASEEERGTGTCCHRRSDFVSMNSEDWVRIVLMKPEEGGVPAAAAKTLAAAAGYRNESESEEEEEEEDEG